MTFFHIAHIAMNYLAVIPAVVLCFLPVKDQFRYSWQKTGLTVVGMLLETIPVFCLLQYHFQFLNDELLIPLLAISYATYHHALKLPAYKSLAVFGSSVALMSILSNLAVCFGSLLHGVSSQEYFLLRVALFQFALGSLFALLLAHPYQRYGCFIVNEMHQPRIWYMVLLFSAMVTAANLLFLPIEFEIMHDARYIGYAISFLLAILCLWMLMYLILYFVVSGLLATAKMEAENRMLETMESQFAAQQRYMKASEKIRHDFRHNIHAMAELYNVGDMEGMGKYLRQFTETMPVNEVTDFCANTPINALLNYYAYLAGQYHVELTLHVELPEKLPVKDVDLCSIIGNILENAMNACYKVEDKWIQLTVLAENGDQLYIVAVNSFDGVIRKKDGVYLSTDRNGTGIGLSSIVSTAETYGGAARFSHEDKRFFSSVMIPLLTMGEQA